MVPPCDDISDFELIRRMADQKIDFAGARNAWGLFYVRHYESVLMICTYDYGYLLGTEGVRDLMQDAFLRAFDGATTFDHAEACEAVVQKRKSRKWLARIAENLVRDRYRGQPEIRLVDDEDLERLGGATDNNPTEIQVPESTRLKLLNPASRCCLTPNRQCCGPQCFGGRQVRSTNGCHTRRWSNSQNRLVDRLRVSDRFACVRYKSL